MGREEKKDHEVSMAKTQVNKSIKNLRKVSRALSKKSDADNLPAWMQAKLTDTDHHTDAAASYMSSEQVMTGPGTPYKNPDDALKKLLPKGEVVIPSKPSKSAGSSSLKLAHFKPEGDMVEGRALGSANKKGSDSNPKGSDLRASSGRGGTFTKAGGLGKKKTFKNNPDGDDMVKSMYDKQAKDDRRADAKQRAAEKKVVRIVRNSFEPEGEMIDEGGLWDNIRKRREKGLPRKKPGQKGYPKTLNVEGLEQARKNVGASKCWTGKVAKGTKMKNGREVPNCVDEDYQLSNWRDEFVAREYEFIDIIKPEPLKGSLQEKKGEEHNIGGGNLAKLTSRAVKRVDSDVDGDVDSNDMKNPELGEFVPSADGKKKIKPKVRFEGAFDWREDLEEDWQKVNKGDKTDGMSQKAVDTYRRENPGSKLKTAVTGDPKPGSKDAKRRKSFCSRSKGQQDMHNIDCSKNPDKAICKARRRWKC